MKKTSDALKILNAMIGDDADLRFEIEKQVINAEIASIIYNARMKAGLSQDELAAKAETTAQIIDDLEEADYDGDAMVMLRRIGRALQQQLQIRLVSHDSQAMSQV